MNGIVLIDKPAGCTSHDVVNRWRRWANTKRVGHLGSLDPMATGLLVLITGTATRLARFFEKAEKTYLAEITFGLVSDTYDADGRVTATGVALPGDAAIEPALEYFRGKILQTPPPVSAKKIRGVPAYKLARKQIPVELEPVEVEITQLAIEQREENTLSVRASCSAGTYMRSLAHDLGQRLGCGAILTKLRRTRAGEFGIEQAKTVDEIDQLASSGRLSEALIPSTQLLTQFPAEYVDATVETQ